MQYTNHEIKQVARRIAAAGFRLMYSYKRPYRTAFRIHPPACKALGESVGPYSTCGKGSPGAMKFV